MHRSLAYWLVLLATTCASTVHAAEPTSDSPTSQAVKVSFQGDAPTAQTAQWQSPNQRFASGFKPLPASSSRKKAAVVLPAAARYSTASVATQSNWTDACVHCGTSGCDGYGCGFGHYHGESSKFSPGGLWVKAEYLYWRISNNNVPALVSSSPAGTARDEVGVLPNAQVLFGNEPIGDDFRSGGRIQFGIWLDDCERWGVQGEFTGLAEDNTAYYVASTGVPGIGRPFFNIDPNVNAEDARLIAFDQTNGDDALDGFVNITSSSNFYTGGMLVRREICQDVGSRWDFLVGYRFAKLDETLTINDQSEVTDVSEGIVGTTIAITDNFEVDNEFHGVDLGVAGTWDMGKWALEGMVKCALGNNQQTVTISGQTISTIPTFTPIVDNQGLLTQTTNIGTYERDQFAIIPEARASASYFVTDNIRVTGGYTLIYIDTVVRPGDQIDRVVNGTLLQGPFAGPLNPAFNFNDTKVFIHGANISLDVMF